MLLALLAVRARSGSLGWREYARGATLLNLPHDTVRKGDPTPGSSLGHVGCGRPLLLMSCRPEEGAGARDEARPSLELTTGPSVEKSAAVAPQAPIEAPRAPTPAPRTLTVPVPAAMPIAPVGPLHKRAVRVLRDERLRTTWRRCRHLRYGHHRRHEKTRSQCSPYEHAVSSIRFQYRPRHPANQEEPERSRNTPFIRRS